MKNTPFTHFHIEMGAKMVPFAGHNMPVQYEGLVAEHINVRNNVGVFDVSHMGEFRAKGPKAKAFMQHLTVNDVNTLSNGKVQYTCLTNEKGGVIDDMLLYQISEEEYFMVPNAANIEKDWQWMSKKAEEMGLKLGEDFINESDSWAQLAVQGPNALKCMQKLTSANVVDMEYYTFQIIQFAGVDRIIFSTTGYTGAGGCEIYIPKEHADHVWKAVFEAGKEYEIKGAGLGCRDTLRLEMGFCLYGHELDDQTTPLESGLGWITKLVEGNDFIARNILEEQKKNGLQYKICGFEMIDRGIPRQDYEVCDAEGNLIGLVRSGTQSPSTGKAIGTAKIKTEFTKLNTEIYIKVREKLLKAVVVKMPFYKG